MEWTKIKTKHFLFSEMKRSAKADLVDLLCLTAHLEKMPTEQQMLKITTKLTLNYIQNWLKNEADLLESVLAKVLEDCEKVNHRKMISRSTSKRYEKSHKKSDVSDDVSDDTIEKRREEKRRINIQEERFSSLWGKYPYKDGKQKAQKFFNASVKDDLGFKNICVALDNYLASDAVQKGYIKKGENWFRDWKDWVDFKPPVVQLKERPKV